MYSNNSKGSRAASVRGFMALSVMVATILVATAAGFTQPAYAANVTLNLQAALSQLQLPAGNYTSPTVLAPVGLTFVPNAAGTPGASGTGTLYVYGPVGSNEVHPPGTTTEAFFNGPGSGIGPADPIGYNVLHCTTIAWTGAGSLTAFTITRPGEINNSTIPAWAMYAYDASGSLLSSTGEGDLANGSDLFTDGKYASFTVSSSTPIAHVVFCSHNGFSTYNALPLSGAIPPPPSNQTQAIHQYHLNENPIVSGTTAALDSAGSLNGTYFGSITSTSGFGGAPNSAAHFDGSSSYIDLGGVNDVLATQPNHTLTAWIKVDSGWDTGDRFIYDESGRIEDCGPGGSCRPGFMLRLTSGQLQYGIHNNGSWSLATTNTLALDTSRWYLVAAVLSQVDGEHVYLFDDTRTLLTSATHPNKIPSVGTALPTIGAWQGLNGAAGNHNQFLGSLQNVTMYNVAMTADQIAALPLIVKYTDYTRWSAASNNLTTLDLQSSCQPDQTQPNGTFTLSGVTFTGSNGYLVVRTPCPPYPGFIYGPRTPEAISVTVPPGVTSVGWYPGWFYAPSSPYVLLVNGQKFLDPGAFVGFTSSTPITSLQVSSPGYPTIGGFTFGFAGNTVVGSNVAVSPVDTTTGTSPVTLTFQAVARTGTTTLTTGGTGPPPPSGFALGSPPTYYDLTTTAGFSGSVKVCINYSGVSFTDPSQLKLSHFEGGAWVDRTVSLDTGNRMICASVTSLSPFAVFERTLPFSAFSAQLQIHFGGAPHKDAFALESSFTSSSGINPLTEPVTLQVGKFTTTIPPGSFKMQRGGAFTFVGVIGGVRLQALITPTGGLRYAFLAAAELASLTGTTNPVQVTLTIGNDSGTISVKALIR